MQETYGIDAAPLLSGVDIMRGDDAAQGQAGALNHAIRSGDLGDVLADLHVGELSRPKNGMTGRDAALRGWRGREA